MMDDTPGPPAGPWRFGVEPLDQTLALAPLMRRITGLALALEQEDPVVDRLIDALRAAEQELAGRGPVDHAPRVGADASSESRVYLDHSQEIGAYNPCFPEYTIAVDGDRAAGTVSFPLAYEGPPGLVHGGFVAVFFDCVIQDHNCEVGQTGKTVSLSVAYKRPTPLLTSLEFGVKRSVAERRIRSDARLTLDGVLLCSATMEAVASDRTRLPEVSPRRSEH
jgi:hypothetical protein